jgi:hypothetical protein
MKINTRSILFYSLGFGIILLSVQIAFIVFSKSFNFNYGYEYGKIATSIYNGTGYSNPWGANTGPTATMPPALVYIHLLGLYLFHSANIYAFLFVALIKIVAFVFSFYFIAKAIEINHVKLLKPLLLGLFVFFILLSPVLNFEHTGDLWISVFIVSWFLYASSFFFILSGKRYIIELGIICFLAPMINPSFALAMMVLLGILTLSKLVSVNQKLNLGLIAYLKTFFVNKLTFPYYRTLLICTLSFGLSIGIWTIRNYLVFHAFIPTKSNLWLEVYLSNIVEKDGVLSYASVLKSHPAADEDIDAEILRDGEIKWFKKYETIGRLYIKEHKTEYYRKVRNRIFNAFVLTKWDLDVMPSSFLGNLDSSKIELLTKHKLIVNDLWKCPDLSKAELSAKLDSIQIIDKTAYLNDWENSKIQIAAVQQSIKYKMRGLLFALIPTIAGVVLLFFSFYRKNILFVSILIIYILYLMPYMLVSHQLRYQRPLMTLQIVLIYFLFYELYKFVFKDKPDTIKTSG